LGMQRKRTWVRKKGEEKVPQGWGPEGGREKRLKTVNRKKPTTGIEPYARGKNSSETGMSKNGERGQQGKEKKKSEKKVKQQQQG